MPEKDKKITESEEDEVAREDKRDNGTVSFDHTVRILAFELSAALLLKPPGVSLNKSRLMRIPWNDV